MKSSSDKRGFMAVAALLALPWVFYFPAFLKPMATGDNFVTMWHTARFAFEQLRKGIDPLWNPYICSGFPVAGYSNTSMYSIFSLPHLFLPHVFALTVQIMLVHGFAAWGLYLFSRRLGASVSGGLVGGVSFAFSGFFLSGLPYSYFLAGTSWTGFVLYALDMGRTSQSLRELVQWSMVASLLLAVQLLAGHPQMTVVAGLMYAIYILWFCVVGAAESGNGQEKGFAGRRLALPISGLAVVLAATALTAALWMPAMELLSHSYRQTIPFERFSLLGVAPHEMLSSAFFYKPNRFSENGYWLGIPVALLAWRGLRDRWRGREARFLAVVLIAASVMGFGAYTPLYRLLYHVPIFNRFSSAARYAALFSFAACCLAALGWDSLRTSDGGLLRGRREMAAFVALLALAVAVKFRILPKYRLLLQIAPELCAGLAALVLIKGAGKKGGIHRRNIALFFILALLPGWLRHGGFSFKGENPRPERMPHWKAVERLTGSAFPPNRFMDITDLRKLSPRAIRRLPAHNLNTFNKWSDAAGYQPLMLGRYGELADIHFVGTSKNPQRALDYRNRAMDLLNVRALVFSADSFAAPETELRLVYTGMSFGDVKFGELVRISVKKGDKALFRAPLSMGKISGLAIVSAMGNAMSAPQGAPVASISLISEDGERRELPVRAGLETAESMYESATERLQPYKLVDNTPFFEPVDMPLWTGLEHTFHIGLKKIDSLAMITYLYNSEKEEQNSPVARVDLLKDGEVEKSFILRAGVDTAHWTAGTAGAAVSHEPAHRAGAIRAGNATGGMFITVLNIDAPVEINDIRVKSLQKGQNSGIFLSHITLREASGRYSSIREMKTAHGKPPHVIQEDKVKGNLYFASWNFPEMEPKWVEIQGLGDPFPQADFSLNRMTFLKPGGASWPLHPVDVIIGDPEKFDILYQDNVAVVAENKRVLPRAWLAGDVAVLSAEDALKTIRTGALPEGTAFEPLKTALLEKNPGPPPELPPTPIPDKSAIRFDKYGANHIKLTVNNSENAMLVLSEVYYPGWETFVDGRMVETLPVDYALRGVVLPAGSHRVEMFFRPRSVRRGRLISVISLLLLTGLLGIVLRRYG